MGTVVTNESEPLEKRYFAKIHSPNCNVLALSIDDFSVARRDVAAIDQRTKLGNAS